MEIKLSNSLGDGGAKKEAAAKKRAPSRLQKRAPASLQLEPAAWTAGAAAGEGSPSGAPIPLLSPLIVSPSPPWETAEAAARREEAEGSGRGGNSQAAAGGGGGWRHPALPTPVAEPASLVPFFQAQCALVRNAQH